MPNSKKLLQAAAGAAGGAGLDVDEVFSTYLYDGNSASQTITNGIDLSGEGGLVWIKTRNEANYQHWLFDTERGATKRLFSALNSAEATISNGLTSFNSNGFTVGGFSGNESGDNIVSWTWRKAPKFFDVVTYTGDGNSGQTINHNLGSVPAFMIVKRTDSTGNWTCYHHSLNGGSSPESYRINLNSTSSSAGPNASYWNNTAPTSTQFTVGSDLNFTSATFVVYLFAHNDDDGEFGPDGDADIIKCGSYTGNGNYTTGNAINVGFEPQWVMIKNASRTDSNSDWVIYDTMRGFTATNEAQSGLFANLSNAETNSGGKAYQSFITSSGFTLMDSNEAVNFNGDTYIYMAIRRGPLAEPENATDVFAIDTEGSGPPAYTSNFPVDMALERYVSLIFNNELYSRLTQGKFLKTNATDGESTESTGQFDYQDGWHTSTSTAANRYSWMWKRAPSYFDVVAYTGNGTAGRTVSHNLGVAPEMIWVKRRDAPGEWMVYHSGMDATAPEDYYMRLSETGARSDSTIGWNDTAPTASVFSLGSHNWVNGSGNTYIAYLFATLAGISKLGSYTGDGTSDRVIDCGFSNGARFVLIKDVDTNGTNWQVFDTARGLTSTKAELLRLNTTDAQVPNGSPSQDYHNLIEPDSSGFKLNNTSALQVNASGIDYIFYAIA